VTRAVLPFRDCVIDFFSSKLCQAAVDGDLAGGHETAVRLREKGSRRREFRRVGHALKRIHRTVCLLAFLAKRSLREFGRRRCGRQHIEADTGVPQVRGKLRMPPCSRWQFRNWRS